MKEGDLDNYGVYTDCGIQGGISTAVSSHIIGSNTITVDSGSVNTIETHDGKTVTIEDILYRLETIERRLSVVVQDHALETEYPTLADAFKQYENATKNNTSEIVTPEIEEAYKLYTSLHAIYKD